MSNQDFIQTIQTGYTFKGAAIPIGAGIFQGEVQAEAAVHIPLKTFNRHGLIAGATGTGKTKTIQVLSEQLSASGVPVLMMDIKGDFSGIAVPGEVKDFITERHNKLGIPFDLNGFPVEFLTLSENTGIPLRATVSEFGPVLFSRILELNDTQSGVVSVIFKYCDDQKWGLIDLQDFKKVLQFITEEGKEEIEASYGKIAASTTGTILRKIIELEQQGGTSFFGEVSFDANDLMRYDEKGRGIINILRLQDIQDKPKLFSTFMLSLLAELYQNLPERGDLDQPELVLFIDEAHLIFNEASKTLLDQIETIVKLIRSKGVGIFFITQNPTDIPAAVLAQLGLKIQHALRAFTANDRKAIKATAENYPETSFYDTAEMLTQLGIGEAFVTALNEKGIPTPLVATMLRAPESRMNVLTDTELASLASQSKLTSKYRDRIESESAYEILEKRLQQQQIEEEPAPSKTSEAEPMSQTTKSVIKVLTSATFIRGAFSILSKILK